MDIVTEMRQGMYCHGAKGKNLAALELPNARDFKVADEDWQFRTTGAKPY
jgi:hypothetical protein